jgi:hypothetical protein
MTPLNERLHPRMAPRWMQRKIEDRSEISEQVEDPHSFWLCGQRRTTNMTSQSVTNFILW